MMNYIIIKQENCNSIIQYLPGYREKSPCIKTESVFEELKTIIDEEDLKLECYSPTNFEYLDEVEDETILDETQAIEEIIDETHLSDNFIYSESDCLPAQIINKSKARTKNCESNKHLQCAQCGKLFKTKSNLKGHEMIHYQIKKHECEVCKKLFLMKCDLTKHLKIHKNERAYKCNVCFKGFNKSNTMNNHIRLVHSGDKSHVCSVCNKGFPLKQQLISHGRTHTGEKPNKV